MSKRKIFAIVGIIGIVILCLLPLMKCEQTKNVEVKPNGVQELIDKKQLNTDSLINESLKEKRLLNQARDSIKLLDKRLRKKATVIIQQAPLQCDSFLNEMIVLWNQSDSAKQAETEIRDKVDSNKDKIIEGLTDINVLTKYQLKQSRDSTKAAKEENKHLAKQVKKEKVKGNFKTIGASILSLFAGFGLSKATP